MIKGNAQIFVWGWNADYPDPENFLFLLTSAQTKVKSQGENATNYANPEYDRLFEQMKNMANSPERQALIDRMIALVREDAPWSWGYHPKDYELYHSWYDNLKTNEIAHNTVKYQRIDPVARERMRRAWNQPQWWPFVFALLAWLLFTMPGVLAWRKRERKTASP